MNSITTITIPVNQVDMLLQEMADEASLISTGAHLKVRQTISVDLIEQD